MRKELAEPFDTGIAEPLRVPAQQQAITAHFPALQPIEKAHAEEVGAQLSWLRNQRRDGTFRNPADGYAIELYRCCAGASVRCLDENRIVEHF